MVPPGFPLYNPQMLGTHPRDGAIPYQARPPEVAGMPGVAMDGDCDAMLLQTPYGTFPRFNPMLAMNHSDDFHSMEQRKDMVSGEISRPKQADIAMLGLSRDIAGQTQHPHGIAALRENHGQNKGVRECPVSRENHVIPRSSSQRPVENHGGVQSHPPSSHPIWSPIMMPPTMTSPTRSAGVAEHAHTNRPSVVTKTTNSDSYRKRSLPEEHRSPSKVQIIFSFEKSNAK